jgi:hypothetical protein
MPLRKRPIARDRDRIRQAILLKRNSMQRGDHATARTFDPRVWRDLTLLAAQSLAIGLAASVLLGLAVFMVA